VAAIGHGLALARGCLTKHAIKQVDRLLSNPGLEIDALLARWVPFVVGSRTSIADRVPNVSPVPEKPAAM
jgi:hypothetical protein